MQIKRLHLGPVITNCYLILTENGAVIIDPADRADRIRRALEGRSILGIVLTHGHLDHFFALDELCEEGVKVYLHKEDLPYLNDQSLRAPVSYPEGEGKTYEVTDLLEEGDRLQWKDGADEICLEVLHTPGHTKGSICLYWEAQSVLFSGDTLFAGTCGRTDFPGGSEEAMRQSLDRLFGLPPQTRVLPGHGYATTIGKEAGGGRWS